MASRAATVETFLEEVDEMTGEVIRIRVPAERMVDCGAPAPLNVRELTPPEGTEAASTPPVVLVHGAGLSSFSWRNMMAKLCEAGHTCYAPDMLGHGKSGAPAGAAYDADGHAAALEAYLDAEHAGTEVDVVMHGFLLPQAALTLFHRRPELVRRVLLLNTPLTPGQHKLPGPLAAFTRPFIGDGAKAEADQLAASGNQYAIKYADAQEFLAPYAGPDGEAYRVALRETVKSEPLKPLLERVDAGMEAWEKPLRVIWGTQDTLLSEQRMYDWAVGKTAVTFDAMTGVGHSPHEDFVQACSQVVAAFFADEEVDKL